MKKDAEGWSSSEEYSESEGEARFLRWIAEQLIKRAEEMEEGLVIIDPHSPDVSMKSVNHGWGDGGREEE